MGNRPPCQPRSLHGKLGLVAGREDSNHILDALSAGATGYLIKTSSRDALIAALREVHAGRFGVESQVAGG